VIGAVAQARRRIRRRPTILRSRSRADPYTPRSILSRNMALAGPGDGVPPTRLRQHLLRRHRTLSSFLIVTNTQGNILIDSTYERIVPVIKKSGRATRLQFSDTKICWEIMHTGIIREGDAMV